MSTQTSRKKGHMKDVADKTIADTGERMVPAHHKGHLVYGEHIVRYRAAMELVKGKTVLDIASGSGYGSACLAETAKSVYGVDIDKDAVRYAQKNYKAKNVEFILGDGVNIPLADNSVDMVVSFETIEHIEDYETFMVEVKRVLKDDGLLLLSTPNDVEFPETNHFHIHEFNQKELEKLVSKYFKHRVSYFQGTWLFNALLEAEGVTQEWQKSIEIMQTAPIDLKRCIYFYMLCSNRPIKETVTPLGAISQHYSERRIQEYEQSVRKHIEDQGAIMEHQKGQLAHKDEELQLLRTELRNAADQLARIQQSLLGRIHHRAGSLRRRVARLKRS